MSAHNYISSLFKMHIVLNYAQLFSGYISDQLKK